MTRRGQGIVGLAVALCWTISAGTVEAQYKAITVHDGGSVRGRVHLAPGSRPAEALPITKDDAVCGSAPSLCRLQVGADGGIANTVVYLKDVREGKRFQGSPQPAIHQEGCEFLPHIQLARENDPLVVVNNDRVLHNVHAYDYGANQRTIFNIAQPVRGLKARIDASQFRGARIVMVTCDAGHPWMSAFLIRQDHPYYAITDSHGNFHIDNIPPGTYTIALWHEGVKIVRKEMEKEKVSRYTYEEAYTQSREVVIPRRGPVRVEFELALNP